jgi:O-antigen ligase
MISLMTLALIVGYAVWITEQKPKPRFFAGITLPALLYLLMVILSLFQAQNLQLGLFGVFLQVQFFLMYFYLANHVRNWDNVRVVMITVTICLLFESVVMLLQYFAGASITAGAIISHSVDASASAGASGSRVGGTIGSPNSAAAYLASTLILTFGAYLGGKVINSGLALVAGSLGAIALVATATRTAWGSLILAVLILLAQILRTDAAKKALGVLLIGGLLVGVFFGGQIWERLAAAATDTTRPELATMARNIIQDFPLGVGENNYDQVMGDEYAHPRWVGHTHYQVHNKYLLVWAETGLQGLATFVLLLLAVAWQSRHWLSRAAENPGKIILAAGFLSALVAYAFHMNTEGFSSRANVQIFWFMMAMLTALTRLIQKGMGSEQEADPNPSHAGN